MFGIPRKCEFCQSPSLRVSKTAKLRWLFRLMFIHPIRCLECNSLTWRIGLFPPRGGRHHAGKLHIVEPPSSVAVNDKTPNPHRPRPTASPGEPLALPEMVLAPAASPAER